MVVDDAGLEIGEQRAQCRQPLGVALARGHRTTQRGEQISVDLVDDQSGVARRERHCQRRLGHAVRGQDRLGPQAERLAGVDEVLDVSRLDRLGPRQREAQRGQVELTRLGLPAQPLGEQRVGEVRRRGHGALVLVDELGPQQRVAQEVHRRDLDELGAEIHRDGQEADHAHVVKAGQPAHHDVLLDVVLGADEHGLCVGVDVAVGDLHRFGRSSRPAGQLHERQIVFAHLDGIDRLGREQLVHGQHRDALFLQHGDRDQERIGDDHDLGLDHADHHHGVFGPHGQIGAWGRLVQHRQARAAHPQALGRGGDLHRVTGEHADGVTEADTGCCEPTGDASRALVDLTPGVPDRLVGFAGHHASTGGMGTAVHLLGESAHHDLLADICPGAHTRLPCSA